MVVSAPDQHDALEGTNAPGVASTARILRNRRAFYGLTTAILTLIVAVALVGNATELASIGVRSARVGDAAGGYQLDVTYGSTSRAGLATPLVIEVRKEGGFDGPISVAVDHRYMELWDENGFYPTPSSETTMGDWLVWEFDPPTGDVLRFTYDGRISPAVQAGRDGLVAVLEQDVPVVSVEFHTRILP